MALLSTIFPRPVITPPKCRGGLWLAVLTVSALFTTRTFGQSEFNEYQLKSVFLFNFAQFVEWPEKAFTDAGAPIVIGILGTDPLGVVLDETVRDERAGGRRLIVRRFRRIEDVGVCHILFISRSESTHLEAILSALKGRSILTVSDINRAALRGVMVRFVTEKKRIRLRINLDEAKLAGLTISSKLLRPTEIVSTEKN